MSTCDRACSRCIAKKRRCDRERPSCGLCLKAKLVCEYPSKKQKRGPTAGSSRASETRIQQLENALYFVMGLNGVTDIAKEWLKDNQTQSQDVVPAAPSAVLEKSETMESVTKKPLVTYGDILAFKDSFGDIQAQTQLSQEVPHIGESGPRSDTPEQSLLCHSLNNKGSSAEVNPSKINPLPAYDNPQAISDTSSLDFLASSAVSQVPTQSLSQETQMYSSNIDHFPTQYEPFDYLQHIDQPLTQVSVPQIGSSSHPLRSGQSPDIINQPSIEIHSEVSNDSSDIFW